MHTLMTVSMIVALLGVALASGRSAFADDAPVTATLTEAVAAMQVELVEGYAAKRPRLLFDAGARAALQAKATARPDLWQLVISGGDRLTRMPVPETGDIRRGNAYWRMDLLEAAALAWYVQRDEKYRQPVIDWMIAHCQVDIWGDGYRANRDLEASWYGYHIAIAYDLLHDQLTDEQKKIIRDGLADHARALRDGCMESAGRRVTYAQNHAYIPAVALATMALVLIDEVDDAKDWLNVAAALMQRSRYALGHDGWYFEGTAYFIYAMHWHVRYAEIMHRATGKPMMDLPAIRHAALYALHMQLPGNPGMFDLGDTGRWTEPGNRADIRQINHAKYWAVASATGDALSQLAGNHFVAQHAPRDYPAAAFRWYDSRVQPADWADVPPYHHFADHGGVAWRSGWDKDATCVLFRSGPSQGHAAAKKLEQMTDWRMNSGHTHPDIGAFWLFAGGRYLAVDTGYTARKFTRDHNTLLIDGQGQGVDGTYWNERGMPYSRFNQSRITHVKLTKDYAYAVARFESIYPEALNVTRLQRTLVATKQWVLTLDEMDAKDDRQLTWLVHADLPFRAEAAAGPWRSGTEGTTLVVLPLTADVAVQSQPTEVLAGTGPGEGTPTVRAHHLAITSPGKSKQIVLGHLLLPWPADTAPPTATLNTREPDQAILTITWPNAPMQTITIARPKADAHDPQDANVITPEQPVRW